VKLADPEPIVARILWQSSPQCMDTHQSGGPCRGEAHPVHENVFHRIARMDWVRKLFRVALKCCLATKAEIVSETLAPHRLVLFRRRSLHERLRSDDEEISDRNLGAEVLPHKLKGNVRRIALGHGLQHATLQTRVIRILEIDAPVSTPVV